MRQPIADDPVPASRQRQTRGARPVKWAGWALLLVLFVSGFFFRFAPATLADSIQSDLRLTTTALGLVASMHFWVYTIMQVPAGMLTDLIGLRYAGIIGGFITGVGALFFSSATGMAGLLTGTAFMGLGLSAVFVSLMTYNARWFPPERHSLIMGVTMLIAALGSVLAESPTAHLLRWFTWDQIIYSFAVLTVVVTALLVILCRDAPTAGGNPGPPGGTLLRGNRRVLTTPQIWLLFLCVGATNGTLYAFLGLWSVPMMTDSFNIPRVEAATYATAGLLAYSAGSLMAGWLSWQIMARKPVIVGAAFTSVAVWGAMAFFDWRPGPAAWTFFLLLGFSGAQVGVIFSATRESVPETNVGFATALVNMGAFLAAAVVQLGFGMILDLSASADTPNPTVSDYQTALLLPFAVAALGFAAALKLKETAPRIPEFGGQYT